MPILEQIQVLLNSAIATEVTNRNNAITTAVAAIPSPQWVKVTKSYTDFFTTGLTNNITIYTLPIKGYIHDVKIIPTTAMSGGLIATYTVSVGIAGTLAKYALAADVFTGNITTVAPHAPIAGLESTSGTTAIKAAAISTVGNLNAATAGSIDFYLLISTLP